MRTEQAGAQQGTPKSLLLHELGVIEERGGDEMGAAREFLAAFNAYPQFREPLEGLVRLLERRKSVKNLPKLLDALLRAAENPEERGRALLKRAAFHRDYRKDDATATTALRQAAGELPNDVTPWLELEVLAGRTSDPDLRAQALEARARLGTDPTWRGFLLIELGRLAAKRGDADRALELLEEAAQAEGGARYPARIALEREAQREKREAIVTGALEAQAELVLIAIENPAEGDRFGVPHAARRTEVAADAWLRAAEARKRDGDLPGAAALLDKAIAQLGPHATILSSRLATAEAAGDTATAERMAQLLLDQGIAGKSGASLWMRVAEAAANRDDAVGALAALTKALEADPACIPARALQIDLLGNTSDPGALAGVLETMAAELPTDEAKGRTYLLAAYVYAVSARDVPGAKAALSQAGMAAVSPGLLARSARMLASITGDAAWYDEATRRLLASGAAEKEPLSLWFELGRNRLLRGEDEGAARAFESIAAARGGGWLGRALGAYAIGQHKRSDASDENGGTEAPSTDKNPSPQMLDQLRFAEPDEVAARALALASARRADLAGDLEGACARLRELFENDAADAVTAVYLADLERRAARPLEAAKILRKAAGAGSEAGLAAALRIEAGVLFFRNGEKRTALEEFEAALEGAEKAVAPLLEWVLSAAAGASLEERPRLLEKAAELSQDKARLTLERIALELLAAQPDAETIASLLTEIDAEEGDLAVASALTRVLSDESRTERDELRRALSRIEARGGTSAAPLASFERLRLARADDNPALASDLAREFASSTRSLAATLEWLGSAFAAKDRPSEVEARRAAAEFLPGSARSAVLAGAAVVALVDDPVPLEPLIASTDPAARLVNLELALPGRDPRRRTAALSGLGDALGNDGPRLDSVLLAGYNLFAFGKSAEALACFTRVTDERPSDLFAWEGVRSAAEALEDNGRHAEASARLGELCSDPARAAAFWEKAGLLRLDALHDPNEAEICFGHAFDRDASRTIAFDRLFRRVRERGESEQLLALIERRIDVADDPAEIGKLFWERARILRKKGDLVGALAALDNVTMIEPDHVGALALKGEVDISQGNFADAATNLGRLATLPEAPVQQRLMSGIAAVDLYENKLGDSMKALEVLLELHKSGLSTLPVRERLARAAAKTSSWQHATQILEELMKERPTAEGRVEAARLAMAIWRDKLRQPIKADRAVTKLLEEAPEDGEALDLVLEARFPNMLAHDLLTRGRDAIVASLQDSPVDPERIARLARIAKTIGDLPLRQATLGALKAAGKQEELLDRELLDLDARVARIPQVAVDDATVRLIGDPADLGPVSELFAVLADSLAEALGPSLEALGVTKRNKIDPRSGLPIRNEIAAWAGALGLGEFDLYIGGTNPVGVQGVPGEMPSVVVGSGITTPLTPAGRQAIVRELFAIRRGTTVTRTRDETTVAAIVVAACHLAEVPIESPPYAVLADVQRQLGKALPRRTRKLLPDICRRIASDTGDLKAWARAALGSMYRMAAIAAGDVSLVLVDALGVPLSRVPAMLEHDDRARRLIAFVLSPRYLDLRRRLGMGVT